MNDSYKKDKLLVDDDINEGEKELDELAEEVTLLRGKMSGHRRTAPQAAAENVTLDKTVKCALRKYELESQGSHGESQNSQSKVLLRSLAYGLQ